jgi:hypothetical protein
VFGPEVNVQKTDYMVMLRNQRAEQNNSIKIGNKFFEIGGQFKYFGTTPTNKIPLTLTPLTRRIW